MKVKKRTVWFLTVVSLAAVISVFYIFEDNTPNILTIFSDETIDETDILGVNQNLTQPVNSESDLFQEVRLELANKRSQRKRTIDAKDCC